VKVYCQLPLMLPISGETPLDTQETTDPMEPSQSSSQPASNPH
jgi:hypothetical protein